MHVKDITYYFQGVLSGNEALGLLEELISSAESFEIFETYLYLKVIYSDSDHVRNDI